MELSIILNHAAEKVMVSRKKNSFALVSRLELDSKMVTSPLSFFSEFNFSVSKKKITVDINIKFAEITTKNAK